jgi:pimeloyl-ACP methyl ester carboxylesterase
MLKNYFHNEWKQEYEKLLDESARFINTPGFPAYARSMALTSDMIFTQPVCYEFKNLQLPVVLIIGQEDRTAIGKEKAQNVQLGNYPLLGKQTAAIIPKCQLIELKGLGHIPHIEDFKQFTDALRNALKN